MEPKVRGAKFGGRSGFHQRLDRDEDIKSSNPSSFILSKAPSIHNGERDDGGSGLFEIDLQNVGSPV